MKNRLVNQSSPYLLQHADNPVAWQPWDQEALDIARSLDKPIFLSVGYSTCHWCHVMAHESFEDDSVAELLNKFFVPIKVDREERPDIDEQYMIATQLFTRRGGWPNSVWLTPDGRPWMAGTYFPKMDRHGQPGFISILEYLAEAWRDKRDDIEAQAIQVSTAIRDTMNAHFLTDQPPLTRNLIDEAVVNFQGMFDTEHAGFSDAPKFPPHGVLRLFQYEADKSDNPESLRHMTHRTLDAMVLGGMYDHIGGGFHRYSVDAHWLVPHFEKMLYDNAQLIRLYAKAIQDDAPNKIDYIKTLEETYGWLQREMISAEGAFYSALDADSEGEEGKCYVWTIDEIQEILPDKDHQLFISLFNILGNGNWTEEATGHPTHTNIPHLNRFLSAHAFRLNQPLEQLQDQIAGIKSDLLKVRDQRPQPSRDDKVLTAWNGLMISALSEASIALSNDAKELGATFLNAAKRAMAYLLKHHLDDHGLWRSSRLGHTNHRGYLDDYAYLLEALVALYQASDDEEYLKQAVQIADQMLDQFEDKQDGAFYSSSVDHEMLILRAKDPGSGGNTPSANGVAAYALFRLAKRTNNDRYTTAGLRTIQAYSSIMAQQPYLNESVLLATTYYFDHFEHKETGVTSKTQNTFTHGPIKVHLSPAVSEDTPERISLKLNVEIESPYYVYGPNDTSQPEPAFVLATDDNSDFKLKSITHDDDPYDAAIASHVYRDSFESHLELEREHLDILTQDDKVYRAGLHFTCQACGPTGCMEPVTFEFEMHT